MSNIYKQAAGGGGGGNITLTPDSGSAIVGTSFNVFGTPYGTSLTPTLTTDNVGGNFEIEPRAYETPYVVDTNTTVGMRGTYTTIQAAINAAVVDGAALANYKVIKLRSQIYTENLTIPSGIIIVGENIPFPAGGITTPYQSSVIIGNHTFSSAATVVSFKNVGFLTSTGDTFTSGSNTTLCYCLDCFFGQLSSGIIFNITSANSYLSATSCQFSGSSTLINLDIGNLYLNSCEFANNGLISIGSNVNAFITDCFAIGGLNCNGSPLLNISDSVFKSSIGTYCISGSPGGIIENCLFEGSAIGVQNTSTAEIINCCATDSSNIIYENGTSFLNAVSQQGNIVYGITVSIATGTPYAIKKGDYYVGIGNANPAGSVILPQAANINQGQVFIIQDNAGNASVNNIVITVQNAATINGALTYNINTDFGCVTVRYDGTNYTIISKN